MASLVLVNLAPVRVSFPTCFLCNLCAFSSYISIYNLLFTQAIPLWISFRICRFLVRKIPNPIKNATVPNYPKILHVGLPRQQKVTGHVKHASERDLRCWKPDEAQEKPKKKIIRHNKNLLCLKSISLTETERKNRIQTVWLPQSVTHEDLIPPKLGSIVCKMTSVSSKLIKTRNKTSPWIRYTVGFPRFNRYLSSCVLGDGSCRKKLIT